MLQNINILFSLYKKDMLHILNARKLIGCETAKLTAQHVTPIILKELTKITQNMKKNINNIEEFALEDIKFHLKIAEYSENPVLLIFLQSIEGIFREEVDAVAHLEKARLGAIKGHEDILMALKNRDDEEASQKMIKHILDVEYFISEYINRFDKSISIT